jgi:hypothetical protein
MKKIVTKNIQLTIIFSITLLSGCDSPRDQRAYLGQSTSGTSLTPNSISSGTTNTSTSTTTTTNSSSTTGTVPTDVSSSCKFSTDGTTNFNSTSNHVGDYTLCQSTTYNNVVYFQMKTTPTDNSNAAVQLCFIPMTNSGSNAIYVGNPMCGYFTNPASIKKITFTKFSNYSNASITGVIFFKDTSYYYQAYNNFVQTMNVFQACMNNTVYNNYVYCNSFKVTNQYVYLTF